MSDQTPYERLLQYALLLISKKRYTGNGIRKKLEQFFKKQGFVNRENIDKVIERLIELRYIDDEKFAQDYVSERVKLRPRGKFLLIRELKTKGIDKNLADKIVHESEIDEYDLAMEALSKRLKQFEKYPVDKRRNKAYQFLASRGFELDAIYKAINSCYNRSA